MSWVPARKGWMKWTKHGSYSISCRQLGAEPTKDASWKAANEWWKKKEAELGSAATAPLPLDAPSQVIKSVLDQIEQGRDDACKPEGGWSRAQGSVAALRRLADQGEAARKMLDILGRASVEGAEPGEGTGPMPFPERAVLGLGDGHSVPAEAIDGVLTEGLSFDLTPEGRDWKLGRLAKRITPRQVPSDRSIASQVDGWVKLQQSKHLAGKISAGRFDAYKRNIAVFRDWIGGGRDIAEISAQTLRDYYDWLCAQIGGRFSAAYSRSLFNASKNFVSRAAELDLIPLPKNIRSRDFVFDDAPKSIPSFSPAEVRALIDGCNGYSERTKLFLLLMLNCGMYQSDLAGLRNDEVDWQAQTISRTRSKRKKGLMVTYKLWPETFGLLERSRSEGGDLVLLSEDGNPLVAYKVDSAGKLRRYDLVNQAYRNLCDRVGIKKPLKVFRKTAANMLEKHREYGRFYPYYLAHSPRSFGERHYVTPSEDLFFEALAWLRAQLLLATVVEKT